MWGGTGILALPGHTRVLVGLLDEVQRGICDPGKNRHKAPADRTGRATHPVRYQSPRRDIACPEASQRTPTTSKTDFLEQRFGAVGYVVVAPGIVDGGWYGRIGADEPGFVAPLGLFEESHH